MIRAPRQDGKKCQLTTVCVGYAASVAADILSAGDYAIAHGDSVILIHGTRDGKDEDEDLTVESLHQKVESLQQENEFFALRLANRMFRRFATQALLLEAFKTRPPQPVIAVAANPMEILGTIRKKVATEHEKLIQAAFEQMDRTKKLFDYIESKIQLDVLTDPIVNDSAILKHLVDFEASVLQERKAKGEQVAGFTKETVSLIQDDFLRLREFLGGSYNKQALELCYLRGHYFLKKEELEEYGKIQRSSIEERHKFLEEKAAPQVFPLWYLVVSLCRLLQQGEHTFTAHDAWWFGLVDEVLGSDLPSVRIWKEERLKERRLVMEERQRQQKQKTVEAAMASSTNEPAPPLAQLPISSEPTAQKP